MNSKEACEAAGITYRMLNYWCRVNLVRATYAVTGDEARTLTLEQIADLPDQWKRAANAPGSGSNRRFDFAEVEFLKLMATLSRAGIEPRAAARYARDLIAHPKWPVYLGDGLVIRCGDWHPENDPQQVEYRDAYNQCHEVR